ncbi:FAD:protein FMN transferase [uncultured Desulfuromusa sp.]|uniref:FAD:protein FMN transferase n=1 Tax=uncultured Desulfuromusa sp. TaxID=219183 RepID=UPI002AA869ED|nr:FAD:protein FMN transferase [uncultured Desulfuromusa sp.]
MKRRFLIIVVLFIVTGCIIYLNQTKTSGDRLITLAGTTMGTSYHIKLAPAEDQKLNEASIKSKVDARLAGIDSKMSTYKENSDVSHFNTYVAGSWMPISAETMIVVNAAQEVSQLSHGAFDITIGNLVNLWGFGPTVNIYEMPDANVIKSLLPEVGYNKLEVRLSPPGLRKSSDLVYLDLSAIAKGYAVDAIAKLLTDNNIENFLVEIGGEIVTHGHKQQQKPWVVGIETPIAGQRSVRKRLHLADVAMATSGDYRNYFEHEGVRYSHTIDPATGYPIKHSLVSVTVIDQSCMRADALATAIMVMGPDKGLGFAEKHQLAIFMLVKQGDHFIEKYSRLFEPYLNKEEN